MLAKSKKREAINYVYDAKTGNFFFKQIRSTSTT